MGKTTLLALLDLIECAEEGEIQNCSHQSD